MGEHTGEILAELGYSETELLALRKAKAVLDGVGGGHCVSQNEMSCY